MGRHSSPEQGPFYRSIVAWLLPWLVIAVVVLVAVWIAIDAVGGDDLETTRVARATPTEKATEEASPTPESTPLETPQPKETAEEEPEDEEVALITQDVTVQVLNGTSAPEADDRMADRLSQLGYEVVAIEGASKQYSETTVFWSFPGAQEAAEALAEKFGWVAGPKPDNLSSTVDLHVVVGTDEV